MLRYERKYLVPYDSLTALRQRVLPFVRPDKYADISKSALPQYTVRSIYFDTRNLECHEEKAEGVELRKKFRIRTYNDYNKESIAVFEIKKKIQNRIEKHRAFTQFEYVEALLESCDIEKYIEPEKDNKGLDDASRFFFHYKMRALIPTVLIVYEREAYQGKFDDGLRITFDKNIRSYTYPKINDIFKQNNLTHLFSKHFILEIKYFGDLMPIWAKSIVQEFKLRHEALSKYTIGYDVNMNRGKTY